MLGYGLIGCGRISRTLAEAIGAPATGGRVLAAYDPHEPARRQFCAEFGCAEAASLEALLARQDVSAVLVASPNDLHCEQTLAAAAAGKHVFCEKPMALSVADCDRMIEACRTAGVKLMVGQVMRLYPLVRRLREVVAAGTLGDPVHGLATYFFNGFRPRESGVWHVERARSGGLFFQMAIHQIDLMLALLGPARRVHYAGARRGSQVRDFDDVASALIEFRSGDTATISVSSIAPVEHSELIVICTRGVARATSPWASLEYGPDEDHLTRVQASDLPGPSGFELELSSFARWVAHDEPPVLTAAEGRAAVAVAEALRHAEETGLPAPVEGG